MVFAFTIGENSNEVCPNRAVDSDAVLILILRVSCDSRRTSLQRYAQGKEVYMGRLSFVILLFIMAISCFVSAGTDSSLGWLLGGLVFLVVAVYAMRQFKREEQTTREGVSISFFGAAMLFMIVAMAFLFWLQFSAH